MTAPSRVHEKTEDLNKLAIQFHDQPQAKRLKMLLFLKANPDISFNELAVRINCSSRTIRRWWHAYEGGGLEQLLGLPKSPRRHTLAPEDTEFKEDASAEGKGREIQDRMIRLLNELPVDADIGEWCREVRDVLQSALEDIDRITVNVNSNCDLLHPDQYQPRLSISQSAYPNSRHKGLGITRHDINGVDVAENLIREFERQGYPVDHYHPPFVLNLEYRGAYLGTIFLWRDRTKPPISRSTLSVFARLKDFLVFAMSDVILRHNYTAPIERAFYATLREVSAMASLTMQEHRVITYRLLGYMYKEIASELDISQDGVKKTLQQVYRKTETGSHIEFFAKYFTARVIPPRPTKPDQAL